MDLQLYDSQVDDARSRNFRKAGGVNFFGKGAAGNGIVHEFPEPAHNWRRSVVDKARGYTSRQIRRCQYSSFSV